MGRLPQIKKSLTTTDIEKAVERVGDVVEINLDPPNRPFRTLRFVPSESVFKAMKYEPCPCGSGKKFKFCCYGKK